MKLDNLAKWQELVEKGILDYALEITNSPYGMIGRINEEGKYNTLVYSSQTMNDCAFPPALVMELSTGMEIAHVWGVALETGKTFLCNDIQAHPKSGGFPEGHVYLKKIISVPFVQKGKARGMIAVARGKDGDDYTEEDLKHLKVIADKVCESNGFENGK